MTVAFDEWTYEGEPLSTEFDMNRKWPEASFEPAGPCVWHQDPIGAVVISFGPEVASQGFKDPQSSLVIEFRDGPRSYDLVSDAGQDGAIEVSCWHATESVGESVSSADVAAEGIVQVAPLQAESGEGLTFDAQGEIGPCVFDVSIEARFP